MDAPLSIIEYELIGSTAEDGNGLGGCWDSGDLEDLGII